MLQDEIRYSDYLDGRVQVAGRPVNTFYSYKFTGLDGNDGRPTFYGTDANEIVGKDAQGNDITRQKSYELMTFGDVCMEVMEHSGCREPFVQGSVSNYFGWRNWGLSFNLAYSIGSKIRLLQMYGDANTAIPAPVMNMRGEFIHRWQRPVMNCILMFRDYWMRRVSRQPKSRGGMISLMNLPERSGICMTTPAYG